jgi:polysaccharide biosynthesis transport protein
MKLIHLFKVLQRHILLLILVPILMAATVFLLTRKKQKSYLSETTVYTGITSGYSVQQQTRVDIIASNAAFDNLMNLIKARQTLEEVSVRLLVQHLMLERPDPRYIARENWEELMSKVPPDVMDIVRKEKRNDKRYYRPPAAKTSYYDTTDSSADPTGETSANEPVPEKNQAKSYYVVKRGETMFAIAKKHGVSVERLKDYNGLATNTISVGQKLIVKDNPAPQSTVELSEPTLDPEPSPATNIQEKIDSANKVDFYNINTETLSQSTRDNTDTTTAFERAVKRLLNYAHQNDYNFIYKLWSSEDPFYSIAALNGIGTTRNENSDLLTISYTNPDPGVCQNTLIFLTKVFIRNYKLLKQNQTDAVIAYFKRQLEDAMRRLQKAENDLVVFNERNNIINYYEQTKAIAGQKEELDVAYQNRQIAFASADAAIKMIERKLEEHAKLSVNTSAILRLRNELAETTMHVANIEIDQRNDSATLLQLAELKSRAESIKRDIKLNIDNLYRVNNSVEGLPTKELLTAWLNNVIEFEECKAALRVLSDRKKQFVRYYEIFAPLGAEMKRIERLIAVTEEEFLQLLHDLNMAKLRQQDDELSTNIKVVDPPYFPLNPQASKVMILVLLSGVIGFVLILAILIAMEYFDTTIKTAERAERYIKLKVAGVYPKIVKQLYAVDIGFILPRLVEIMAQNIKLALYQSGASQQKKPLYILFFSTRDAEGKTTMAREISRKLKSFGENVLYLNYVKEQPSNNAFLSTGELVPPTDDEIQYGIRENFVETRDISELMQGFEHLDKEGFDYIFAEVPSLINNAYPLELIKNFNMALLVVRANRSWTDADIAALTAFKGVFKQSTQIILNGVELEYLDSVFGDVPKQRSKFRRTLKRILLFQFKEKNGI